MAARSATIPVCDNAIGGPGFAFSPAPDVVAIVDPGIDGSRIVGGAAILDAGAIVANVGVRQGVDWHRIGGEAARTITPAEFDLPKRTPRSPRIAILGGSFNPAHDGHREISLWALDRLGLDLVWWLVSPQNPLKTEDGMAPFAERFAAARAAARHPRIVVTDIEKKLGSRYTAQTLTRLIRRFPNHRFVWLMGADNLIQIDRWQHWQRIFHTVPIAVFSRPSYSMRALAAKAARRFAKARLSAQKARELADREPPAWVFIHGPANRESATAIRARTRRTATADATARTGGRRVKRNAGATSKG